MKLNDLPRSESEPKNISWSKSSTERWAPFKEDGSLADYNYRWRDQYWREVSDEFEATLEYVNWGRGRSAVTFYWKDVETGATHPMFASDLHDMIINYGSLGKITNGVWKVVKKGSNYGIKLVRKNG